MLSKHSLYSLLALSMALSMALLLAAPASADEETGFRLKVSAAAFQATGGGGFDPSFGGGLALEYRASRRWGFEVSATTATLESHMTFEDVIVPLRIDIESRIETTPVLARLNWHLTPEKKADLYLGPVLGWVRYGDVEFRVTGDVEAFQFIDRLETEDAFVWGAHIGLDMPVGTEGWFWNTGLTYLEADVESRLGDEAVFDLNPLVAHIGLGFRF